MRRFAGRSSELIYDLRFTIYDMRIRALCAEDRKEQSMIRDEIMEWAMVAVMWCAVILVAGLVAVTSYGAGVKQGKNAAEAERKARIEYRCWCEEWADVRATQEAYLRERRGR